jgi:Flp pilus assembly protein TadG
LVAPILILILGAILQFGYIFAAQLGVINATREAARNAAATTPTLDTTAGSTNGDFAYQRLRDTWLPRNVMAYDAGGLDTSAGTTQVCYASYTDASSATAIQVTVTTVYRHRLFVPLVANIIDGLDGSTDGWFRTSATETMRVANPVQLPSYTGNIPAAPGVCYQ